MCVDELFFLMYFKRGFGHDSKGVEDVLCGHFCISFEVTLMYLFLYVFCIRKMYLCQCLLMGQYVCVCVCDGVFYHVF